MSFYVSKVKRKKGVGYRIVKDITRNGRRDRSYFTLPVGTTKAVADKICCQMALDAEFGEYMPKTLMLFKEYAEEIYFPKYTQYLSPTTRQHYNQVYTAKDGLKKHLGDYYLSEITVEVLQDMVNHYNTLGKAPKTIRNILNIVAVILEQAMNDNYLKRHEKTPCAYVRLPKLKEKSGQAYTITEVKTMLDRARKTGNRNVELLIAICCLAGGLRRSELVGLRWEDITLNDREAFIKVERAIVYTNEGLVEKETKTEAGARIIPIIVDGTVYNILQRARKEYLKLQLSHQGFQGDNHVFILNHLPYTPLTPVRIYKIFKQFMAKECPDLPSYRLHDLRHTYFSLCSNIEGFSDLSMISTGGHSTIHNTRRYQHPQLQKMLSDMEKLEQAFDNTVEAVNN